MIRYANILPGFILFIASASADVVEESLQQADVLWDKTVEYAGATLDRARRLWREEHPEDAQLWEDLIPRLDEIIVLQDRQRQLPESAWFGDDQASNTDDINALLDEVADILIGDNTLRERMHELTTAMDENRQAVVALKRRKMSAPSDSMWRKTVGDIEDEIDERERLLAEQRQAMADLHTEAAAELRAMGLDIDAEGLEFLLSTVVGDDVMDMTLAFEQVRALTEQLEILTVESREDLPTARRYYGMYVVLLKTLDHMHVVLLDGIATDYLPRIDAIGRRARELQQETQTLIAQRPSKVLESNLAAQQLTIEAAGRYAGYLKGQQRQVEASRQRLAQDIAVAQNTYETVKMSGDLVAMMQDSRQLLDSLFRLQVPPLRAFENLEMKREFQRLTSALRQESA
ncbi:MAG: hypothetical protein WBN68_06170 [Sedimenticolaceae bacterium]